MYINGNPSQSEMTAAPSKYPQKHFKDKECRICRKTFSPLAPSHMHCSQECADESHTTAYLKRNYNITLSDYRNLLRKQNNSCAICGGKGFKIKESHKTLLVVDHCHATGEVRGLLCHNCNRGLGLLGESGDNLLRASKYVYRATTIPNGSTPEANAGGSGEPLEKG